MPASLFVTEVDTFTPTELSRGPWGPNSLHGGPVAALLARQLSLVPTVGPMFPARLTIELLRPVVIEPMTVETSVVRPGRKVQVLEAVLHREPGAPPGAETRVARATLQQIRDQALALPTGLPVIDDPTSRIPPPDHLPTPETGMDDAVAFHSKAVEHRSASGSFTEPGPARDWIRVTVDLLPDSPLSPFERVVAAADFGNGISSMLPFPDYMYVNPDLSVFLERLPEGEWVGLDAVTHLGPRGTALAESVLFDRAGRIGRAVQTLIIDRA